MLRIIIEAPFPDHITCTWSPTDTHLRSGILMGTQSMTDSTPGPYCVHCGKAETNWSSR